jgi:hypothetical protein
VRCLLFAKKATEHMRFAPAAVQTTELGGKIFFVCDTNYMISMF